MLFDRLDKIRLRSRKFKVLMFVKHLNKNGMHFYNKNAKNKFLI